jgi:hypothetical protein
MTLNVEYIGKFEVKIETRGRKSCATVSSKKLSSGNQGGPKAVQIDRSFFNMVLLDRLF